MRFVVPVGLAVLLAVAPAAPAGARQGSLRFFGNGTDDIDRVKIRVDDPATDEEPRRPADVGARELHHRAVDPDGGG